MKKYQWRSEFTFAIHFHAHLFIFFLFSLMMSHLINLWWLREIQRRLKKIISALFDDDKIGRKSLIEISCLLVCMRWWAERVRVLFEKKLSSIFFYLRHAFIFVENCCSLSSCYCVAKTLIISICNSCELFTIKRFELNEWMSEWCFE